MRLWQLFFIIKPWQTFAPCHVTHFNEWQKNPYFLVQHLHPSSPFASEFIYSRIHYLTTYWWMYISCFPMVFMMHTGMKLPASRRKLLTGSRHFNRCGDLQCHVDMYINKAHELVINRCGIINTLIKTWWKITLTNNVDSVPYGVYDKVYLCCTQLKYY